MQQEINIDDIKINFDSSGLWVLNIAIAIIMFGVALGITLDDFRRLFKNPKTLFVGVLSQFILLPAFTFFSVIIIEPHPSLALTRTGVTTLDASDKRKSREGAPLPLNLSPLRVLVTCRRCRERCSTRGSMPLSRVLALEWSAQSKERQRESGTWKVLSNGQIRLPTVFLFR